MTLNINLEKSVGANDTYLTGELITFTIKYANPSTTDDALNLVITDVLPSNLEYVSATPSEDVTSYSYDGNSRTITFNMVTPLAAGSTGFVEVVARFPIGTSDRLPSGRPNSATNSASATGSNVALVTSNPVTVYPSNIDPTWSIDKFMTIPANGRPAIDSMIEYGIWINPNSYVNGAASIENVVLVDTLPANASFISASNGGAYDIATNTVTWNIGTISPGNGVWNTVRIQFPENTVTETDYVTDTASATGNIAGYSSITITDPFTHGFAPTIVEGGYIYKYTRTSDDKYSIGQPVQFLIAGIGNSGNTSLDKLTMIDDIPQDIDLTSITTGSYYNSDHTLTIYYQTNLNSYQLWPGAIYSYPNNAILLVSSLGLASNEYITQIKYEFTGGASGIQSGFSQSQAIQINGIVKEPASGNTITNQVSLTAEKNNYPSDIKNASSTITVISPIPWLQTGKYITNNIYNYIPGSTVEYAFYLKNHEWATGNLIDPLGIDVLPSQLENIVVTGVDTSTAPLITSNSINPNYSVTISGTTYQAIEFKAFGSLRPGEYITVKYTGQIKSDALNGWISNDIYMATQDPNTIYQNPTSELIQDANDLNHNGSTTDYFIKSSTSTYINFIGALSSIKWLLGELDTTWSKYPDYGQTLPGGLANYRLQVKNDQSNGPITNITVIDILPYVGDIGVIDPQARNSKWSPYLVQYITGQNGGALPVGTTVYYTTNPNPSRIELTNPYAPLNPNDGWSTIPPTDITTVRALKFTFGSLVLNMGDEINLEWEMRAPVGAPVQEIAWNSFGYIASFSTMGGTQYFLPSEPIKVGHLINAQPTAYYRLGDYVWEDFNRDGIQNDGQSGINNILVNLYQVGNTTPIAFTRTGFDQNGNPGYYEFPYVAPGDYSIEFIYPQYYRYTLNKVGSPDLDSDILPGSLTATTDLGVPSYSVKTPVVSITNSDNLSMDLGLYQLASIGDYVWFDKNGNGIQEAGELPASNVTILLLHADSTPVLDQNNQPMTTISDQQGLYEFKGLIPGEYIVQFINPDVTQYEFTTPNAGSNADINSKALSNGKTNVFSVQSGQSLLNIDAGLRQVVGSIGDYVWLDKNGNGLQDDNEKGLSNVTVKLLTRDGQIATDESGNQMITTTNDMGFYSFTNLVAGDYIVEFTNPDSSKYEFTIDHVASNIMLNSKAYPNGKTDIISLQPGEVITNIDAGFKAVGAILGDRVWFDQNKDGLQDPTENGVKNVTVNLLDSQGNPILDSQGNAISTVTDSDGKYIFYGLSAGTYMVEFINPKTYYEFTTPHVGNDYTINSSAQSNGRTDLITLAPNDINLNNDAGLRLNSTPKGRGVLFI